MKKCLIVDDVTVTLFATKRALSDLGMDSSAANTSQEALSTLRKDRFDVVFLDWHLGKESGIDLLKDIRKEYGNSFQIVMCSGVESANKHAEAMAAGANAFLEKPTSPEKIKECLKNMGVL